MDAPGRRRRSDASRNHETILTAAIAVLAAAPRASMAEVAQASGTGRTTLYRHFPDRAALVDAIYDRVLDEADTLTRQRLESAGGIEDPVEVVAGLCVALAGLGDRYRFLESHDAQLRAKDPEDARRRGLPLRAYLQRGRSVGRVRADLDADWQFAALAAIITEASGHRFASVARRATDVRATVAALLAPPPRA
jgi:AcrR family transcriptional regulator